MTKTNKAFAYITNTAREDRKVACVLSGWRQDHSPAVVDIGGLDHTTRERLECLQAHLYSSCTGLKDTRLNVSSKVCSSLTAHLVRYYPSVKALAPEAPIVTRVEECMAAAGISTADMLAWSVVLSEAATAPGLEHERNEEKPDSCTGNEQLLAVIEELIASNRAMAARLTIVEAALLKPKATQETTEVVQTQHMSDHKPKLKRRKKQVTNLSTTWYEWYTRMPRVWDSADRHKKSKSRHMVAFMKLFLDAGFALDTKATDYKYKDHVLQVGQQAEALLLVYLRMRGIQVKGAGSVLRALCPLHKSGELDSQIVAYKHLLSVGRIQDPAPLDTQDILALTACRE